MPDRGGGSGRSSARGGAQGWRIAAIGAVAAVTLTGGCGGVLAPDLLLVERAGSVAGARLTLLVNEEGGVRCNGGRALKLSDSQLVQAPDLQEALRGPASRHLSLPARAGSRLR